VDPDSRDGGRPGVRGRRGPDLHVTVTDGRGRSLRDGGLSRWLGQVAPTSARGEVAVALVTDAHSRKLNSHYRRTNAPTDVLSFPAVFDWNGSRPSRTSGSRIPDHRSRQARLFLGDIVIATGTARKQAREAGHSYQTELRVLALHGLLHLLGYDHEDRDDAGRMARVESRLRRRGRLRAGLIERS
jgi:probable rRNA maturation factor